MEQTDGISRQGGAETDPAPNVTIGRRETQRARVQLAATLSATTRDYPVALRNLSCTGAMVEGEALPATGRTVALKRGGIDELADVVWVRGSQCGLHFLDPIAHDRVLAIAACAPEAKISAPASLYTPPALPNERLSAEDWARAKLRASRMPR